MPALINKDIKVSTNNLKEGDHRDVVRSGCPIDSRGNGFQLYRPDITNIKGQSYTE